MSVVISTHKSAESENFVYHVTQCHNLNTISAPILLEKEYQLYTQQGLKFYPALFVNGDLFRVRLICSS